MKLVTQTKKRFTGYWLSVEVSIEDKSVFVNPDIFGGRNSLGKYNKEHEDTIRLRDTAEALLAAADFLDSLSNE